MFDCLKRLLYFAIVFFLLYNFKKRETTKNILNIYAQVLNLKWQLNAMIINQGLEIIDTINEYKRWEREYEDNKKRIDFRYQQIRQEAEKRFRKT